MSDILDEEVVLKVQKGDIESFGLLMQRFEPKLLRYGSKFMSSRDDIKDLVQETFIKTYTNIQSFDTSKKFSPWIYRIAHNEFVNAIKKKKLKPLIFCDLDEVFPHLASEELADTEANDRELKESMSKGLDSLDLKYREVLVLYYFENMDYEAISEVIHIPVSTVGVRLSRGKALFKKVFKI
jgi:RNA polymerase sigma-70 factor (ECF subfamily)